MKQSIPTPVAVIIGILIVGVLGFVLYNHFIAGPDTVNNVHSATAGAPGMTPPQSKEEGMKMYGGGNTSVPSDASARPTSGGGMTAPHSKEEAMKMYGGGR